VIGKVQLHLLGKRYMRRPDLFDPLFGLPIRRGSASDVSRSGTGPWIARSILTCVPIRHTLGV
jgi:hypothetical protein